MEEKKEGLEPQKPPETVVLPEEITISQTELDELKHKAEVSSQNFERAKKAESRVKELEDLEDINLNPEYEGEAVKKVQSELSEIKGKLIQAEVKELYPQLKEVWEEFETFLNDDENKGMSIKTAAKAFLTEKGLLVPKRIGLEKPSGGPRVPISSGMSSEDVKKLRETNYRKYLDMLSKDQIKIS
ncbi:MAG: hypothetical protein AAB922_07240 [Patescibacteria group bacterium]